MSNQVSNRILALSILGGICWIVQLLSRQIWHIIEWFGGLEFSAGLFVVIGIDYAGEVLVAILAFCLLWIVLRDNRSFHQLERGIQIAVLAGLAFLILTPFDSSMFYFIAPQPESRTVTAILYIARNISVALLIGSIILPRITSKSPLST